MPNGLTRIVVINPRIEQAISVKKVLEPLGKYDVRPFTTLENALTFSANEAPPDLVVMDVELRGYKVGEVIAMLRRRRPNLLIVLTGTSDENALVMGAQAGLEKVRGRDLLPIIERLVTPLAAMEIPPIPKPSLAPSPSEASRATQPDRTQLKTLPTPPEIFPQLAAEEPPVPHVAEGGTVRDLRPSGIQDSVVEVRVPDLPDTPTIPLPEENAETVQPSLPQQILERAQSDAPRAVFDDNDADLDSQPQHVEASIPEVVVESPPPTPEPSHSAKTATHPIVSPEPSAFEVSAPPPVRQLGRRKPPKSAQEPPTPAIVTQTDSLAAVNPNEIAARKALQLTQAATESTAAACILTLGADLIAHAGELPDEEVEELRGLLKDDWQPTGRGNRIRFLTLPSTGQDYMLIARRTEDGYTLTMVFAGDVPLSDIRRQAETLVRALAYVPTPEPELVIPSLPMTAIWTLKSPDQPLTAEAAQAIVVALDTDLGAGWRIHNLNVHAEYIYVYCDTPADSLPGDVVNQLRQLTEQAVFSRMPERTSPVWSDSYLALVPGREMGADEVRRFLRFSRMSSHPQTETP